jgi:hypothetical protein
MSNPVSKGRRLRAAAWMVVVAAAFPSAALAYVGPGLGLSAIGSFLALVGALFLGLLGFVWYPVKRLIRLVKGRARPTDA